MPRPASNQSLDRDRLRSRPSSTAQQPKSNTPVLFRLPRIESEPAEFSAQMPVAASATASEVEIPVGPRATPVPSPTVPPQLAFQTSSAAAVLAASMPLAASTPLAPGLPLTAAQTMVPGASQATLGAAESRRSWWEHWSSGIVLLLLIVALVTASIIALNDDRTTKTQQLAIGSMEPVSAEPASAEFDLTQIQIPTLASPIATDIQFAPQPAAIAVTSPASTAENISSASPSLLQATDSPSLSDLQFSLLPADSAPIESKPADSVLQPVANSQVAQPRPQVPLATLSAPMGVVAPKLFTAQAENGISTLPQAAMPNTMTASGPSVPPTGASPSFYDGAAATVPNQTAAAGSGVLETATTASASGPVDTNMPSFAALLTNSSASTPTFTTAAHITASPNVGSNTLQLPNSATTYGTPVLTSADQGQSVDPSRATNANRPAVAIPSATPNSNTEELIRSYQHWSAQSARLNGQTTNRYPAGGSSPATAVPPAQPARPGFTLGGSIPTR